MTNATSKNKSLSSKENIKKEIEQIIQDKNLQINAQLKNFMEEAAYKLQTEPVQIKDVLHLNPLYLEKVYTHGYNLFQAGKYKDALLIFSFLREMDETDSRYSFCLAACHHYLKNYNEAAFNYLVYSYLELDDPLCRYHLYDCLLQTDQIFFAARVILECIGLCGNHASHQLLKKRAQLELQHVEKLIKEKLS